MKGEIPLHTLYAAKGGASGGASGGADVGERGGPSDGVARRVSSGTGSAKNRRRRSRTRLWCAGSSRSRRRTRAILPATTTIEPLCADALVDAERRIEARIAEWVPPGESARARLLAVERGDQRLAEQIGK